MGDFIAGLQDIALWFLLPTFALAFILGLSEAINNLIKSIFFKEEEPKDYINVTVLRK